MKIIFSLFLLVSGVNLFAAETDDFTFRNEKLADMSGVINEKANLFLKEAVELTNAQGSCDEKKLYSNLETYFANHTKGKLTQYILESDEVVKHVFPISESVYKEWSITDGFLLGRDKEAQSALAFAPLVRIGEETIGSDKFEHMFGMGLDYFTAHYLKGKGMTRVLKSGALEETVILGGTSLTTGIFAYGDLSANFNGMRFWNHVLQKKTDILGAHYNVGPFVKCEGTTFVTVRPIDFRNYVDASMNESVNCSHFATRAGLRKFKASLKRLGNLTCPLDPELNREMQKKYAVPLKDSEKTISDLIINTGSNTPIFFN